MFPASKLQPRPAKRGSRLSRLARGAALALALVLLLPYVLVPLYRVINPISTLMLWRWATGARVERSFVPIERMAPALPVTVIASEDGRFCTHGGIDWREIRERLEDVDEISAARGVSTISQQTAKNLFLWPGRSFLRKGLELPLALWIDLVLPKWRVLEIYLNVAEWGPNGQFGAETGSRYAFNKSARSLTPREAALLAAVLPNPRRRSAKQPGPAVRRLAAIYEARGAVQASLAFCAKPAK
ncbi:MAG: monofunctional biosynthetic peptidoglycan transglycosylase [Alphaproteobacteria bacterium]|nr:MAG: monofunctional biosynthetic peptidoglycan transglycosylase [Alphaproteobacteria bacterium]